MARINVEDKLLKDPRFTNLCIKLGSRATALGSLVDFWIEAQTWYKGKTHPKTKEVIVPRKSGIPALRFATLGLAQSIIDCGLAKIVNDEVHATGEEEYFAWLLQKVDAGSKDKKNKESNQIEIDDSTVERGGAEQNAAEPHYSLLSSHYSNTLNSINNIAKKESKLAKRPPKVPPLENSKAHFFIKTYCQLFKTAYGINPDISKPESGIAKRIASDLTEEKIAKYLAAYFSMPDTFLFKIKHPIAMFETKKNQIIVFAETGNFTTNSDTKEMDRKLETKKLFSDFLNDGKKERTVNETTLLERQHADLIDEVDHG